MSLKVLRVNDVVGVVSNLARDLQALVTYGTEIDKRIFVPAYLG